jgi:hypothetical protein
MDFGSGMEERAMTLATSQARELAVRDSDGVHVRLLWHPGDEE